MSADAKELNDTPPAPRWRLWVDGCGGFLLLTGNRWTVGGVSHESVADICVRADLPRLAGTIQRSGADYFWLASEQADRPQLIRSGEPLDLPGSATLSLQQPSALCDSAALTVKPPHRFDQHVDGVVLANETVLVGPSMDCHIRCRDCSDRAVLIRRGNRWIAKVGLAGESANLEPGKRVVLRTLAMTLEPTGSDET